MRVKIGEEELPLHEFNGRRFAKAVTIIASLEEVGNIVEEHVEDWKAKNQVVLERPAARMAYGPQPLLDLLRDESGEVVRGDDGRPYPQPMRDADGGFVLGPDPLGHLTNEDWQAMGNVLRMPKAPEQVEELFFTREFFNRTLVRLLAKAQDDVVPLLALCVVSDREYAEKVAVSEEEAHDFLKEKGGWLLDTAKVQQLVALAFAAGELLKDQFKDNVDGLVETLKNALARFGVQLDREPQETETTTDSIPEPQTSEPSSEPTSSTNSTPRATATPKKKRSTARSGERSPASSPA